MTLTNSVNHVLIIEGDLPTSKK